MSWSNGRATVVGTMSGNGKQRQVSTSVPPAVTAAGGNDYVTGHSPGQESDGHVKDG